VTSIPASHRDLIEGANIGAFSTVGRDGGPQVTALWYLTDGDTVVLSVTTDRQNYKNAVRHPRATLFVIDPTNPFRSLEVRGDASIEEDPDLTVFEQIIRHYGQDPTTFPAPRRQPRGASAHSHSRGDQRLNRRSGAATMRTMRLVVKEMIWIIAVEAIKRTRPALVEPQRRPPRRDVQTRRQGRAHLQALTKDGWYA
jgi:PPOX class probable F420-dependent enzyme